MDRTERLATISAVASSIAALALLAIAGLAWKHLRPADYRDVGGVTNVSCHGDLSGVDCVVTNRDSSPLKTCLEVRLEPNGKGERVVSGVACTGRLDTAESRALRLPWLKPILLACANAAGQLDWSACELKITAP